MSAYSTPTRICFDEGFSPSSNQSFYFTPRETFTYPTPQTRSRKRATPFKGKVPKFNICDEEFSRSEDTLRRNNDRSGVSSPIPISARDTVEWACQNAHSAKEAVISIDKENIGLRFCSTPSLPLRRPQIGYTPLRNISNQPNDKNATVFEARISSVGKHFDLRIRTEADVDQPTKCSVVQKSPCFSYNGISEDLPISVSVIESNDETKKNRTLLRDFGESRRLQRKSIINTSEIVQKSSAVIGIDLRSSSRDAKSTDVPRVEDEITLKNETLSCDKNSLDRSLTPLLVENKELPRKIKFWRFVKIKKKLRISPVKRLFTKSTRYLILFKEKIAERISRHPIKTLLNPKLEEVSCISTETNSVQTQRICTLCLENLSTKEEAMSKVLSALMTKLSSMEEELKEIKGHVKNNANSFPNHGTNVRLPPLPPPPPPPPPPPNFLNSEDQPGTLKRKLTTPENVDHAVKRPAIKNEKTQFSITVEDIRSVKLRKTPAHVFKPRERNQSNTVNIDETLRSSRMKRNTNFKNCAKRTQSLAELSSRENVSFNRNVVMDSSNVSTPYKENPSIMGIHEETPISSKNTLVNNRPQKRKEWLMESPIRKRVNTGNNSSICCDIESKY